MIFQKQVYSSLAISNFKRKDSLLLHIQANQISFPRRIVAIASQITSQTVEDIPSGEEEGPLNKVNLRTEVSLDLVCSGSGAAKES